MEGRLEHELEVCVPADVMWETYKGLKIGKLVSQLFPLLFHKVEAIEGGGGVGTVLNVVLAPGTIFSSFKEKFTEIDEEKRIKVTDMCEGGFLDLGFSFYRVISEIIEASATSCIIKYIIEYKADTGADVSMVSIEPFQFIAEAVGKHLAGNSV